MSPRVRERHGLALEDSDPGSFNRPKRGSRARTKVRPDYSNKPIGMVLGVDRGRYEVLLDTPKDATIRAMKARELGRNSVIVGDRVRLTGDISGAEGTLARIAAVEPRTTELLRTADDTTSVERPIVANADQLMIVVALVSPPPRTGMIDRILVAAYDAGIKPILCLTKADLAAAQNDEAAAELQSEYAGLDLPILITEPGVDLDPVRAVLHEHTTVLIGHSGVGKSTLINALVPGANRVTGAVNDVTGKGRHTSTSAVALPLPGGGEGARL
jgi:ribosome biogenesis GTPase